MTKKPTKEQISYIRDIMEKVDIPIPRISEYHEDEIIGSGWLSKKEIDKVHKNKALRAYKTSEGIFINKKDLHRYLKSNQEKGTEQLIFENKIMRVSDVAELLRCSKGHIYNLTSQDEIPFYKKGKSLYFFYTEIQDWIMEGNL